MSAGSSRVGPSNRALRCSVLVVDDEAGNRLVAKAALEGDFDVLLANDGRAALECLRQQCVAVILADNRMPGMSGVELLKQARLMQPLAGRILVTAYVDLDSALSAINEGNVGRYIEKPWSREVLLEAVHHESARFLLAQSEARLRDQMVRRERAEAAQAAVGFYMHDVSNVVMALADSVEELEMLTRTGVPSEAVFPRWRAEVARLAANTGHLGELVRRTRRSPQARRSDTPAQPADLAVVFRQVRRMLGALRTRGILLEFDCPGTCRVEADGVDIARILHNLASNAMHAIQERGNGDGKVSISARIHEDWIEVRVRDDGPGLPQEVRERLFEPWSTTRSQYGGSGLGLHLSRLLAEANGGRLELADTRKGCCFVLHLRRASGLGDV